MSTKANVCQQANIPVILHGEKQLSILGSLYEGVCSMSDGAWITTKEAAEMLGVSDARIRQLLLSGRLKGKHFGRAWMVSKKSSQELANRRSKSEAENA